MLIARTAVLPRWVGGTGLVVSGLYLLNQGDILATGVPDFPVWDLAGLLGSSLWGLWAHSVSPSCSVRAVAPRSDSHRGRAAGRGVHEELSTGTGACG